MTNHLTEDQFARCAVGQGLMTELQHLRECADCSVELDMFKTNLGRFGTAIRQTVDDRLASRPWHYNPSRVPATFAAPMWRLGIVFASILALVLPFLLTEQRKPEPRPAGPIEMDANAIMNAVNRHLSRTVPAPMEPAFSLIPSDELVTQPGGVQ
jgi:hypothetical protein